MARPLAHRLGTNLTLVINTGDDHWRYGLRICPDLDTNVYALAGLQDRERGWGVADDTFRAMDRLRLLGATPWFSLGDLDLAMHLRRTAALREGTTLTALTAEVTGALGIGATVLPMTDSEVETRVTTPSGERSFEEYLVRDGAVEPVERVDYRGIESAAATPQVLEAIDGSDLVVIGPSNPVSSIGPILALDGVTAGIRRKPCIVVTSVVSGVGPVDEGERRRARSRAAQMRSVGLDHDSFSVARLHRDLADAFVLDVSDRDQASAIESLGPRVFPAVTILDNDRVADELAASVLDIGEGLIRVGTNCEWSCA